MPHKKSTLPVRTLRQSTEAIKNLEALVTSAQSGNISARDKVIKAWLPWINDQARMYAIRAQRLDLIQDMQQVAICGAGNMLGGLMKAIEAYDSSKGSAFHSYAIYWINKAFHDMLGDNHGTVTRSVFERRERIRAIASDLRGAFGKEPTYDEIRAAARGYLQTLTDEQLYDMLSDLHYNKDRKEANYEERQDERLDAQSELTKIQERLQKSSKKHQDVFHAVCFEGKSYAEVGKEFDLWASSVRNIVEKIRTGKSYMQKSYLDKKLKVQ